MTVIGGKNLEIPILQGGMGVGVSLGRLAGSVAACGGMGTISTANIGYQEPDFEEDPFAANLRALQNEIRRAFSLAGGKGAVAVNAMVETSQFEEAVQEAVRAGADAIVSGAGLPLQLPKFTKGTKTAAAPVVSSGKAASVICKMWDRHYAVAPDFVVLEGSRAGGHLGFHKQEVISHTASPLTVLLREVREALQPFEQKYGRKIPVFPAGGIRSGREMADLVKQGASGIQIATRLIATPECDASEAFKQILLQAKDTDICIIDSPVGMPGRALKTELLKRLQRGEKLEPLTCSNCLKHCPHRGKVPYCISRALIAAVKGDVKNGLFFTGTPVEEIREKKTVREILTEFMRDYHLQMAGEESE